MVRLHSCNVVERYTSRMQKWLSGRRRTIGNRVTVNSGSRVQIPSSAPRKVPETEYDAKFSELFLFCVKNANRVECFLEKY